MDDFALNKGESYLHSVNLRDGHFEEIPIEDNQVGSLPHLDRPGLAVAEGKVGAPDDVGGQGRGQGDPLLRDPGRTGAGGVVAA